MPYIYAEQRAKLFTEQGVELLTKIRDRVRLLLREAGAVRFQEVTRGITGDSWAQLAVFDYLVEKKELRELTPSDGSVAGQHRVFVGGQS